MSRVFLAEDLTLGREVVVKVLPPEMAEGVSTERFRREMQTIARLQHPHIVPILSAGSAGGVLFYIMPFIKGESLHARIQRDGALPVNEAARILAEVADALEFAHAQGVVHRDIKPDNILLSSGHALVTDFGVAKALGAGDPNAASGGLTSVGIALGTPMYMAPEQATADPNVDHRADLYALGAMGYEMLAGQPPFHAPTAQALIAAHITKAPEPLHLLRDTIPEALEAVIHRCLAKRPADRFQGAAEVKGALGPIAHTSGTHAPTRATRAGVVPSKRRITLLFAAAALGVVGATWGLAWLFGLPDWVVAGAGVLLAVGFPVTLRAARTGRLRRAVAGGGIAFGALALGTGGFMGLRAAGVGPFATLRTAGMIGDRERLLVAEFANTTSDSLLGAVLTQAITVDLSQSPNVRLLSPAEITAALQRMQRPPETHLTTEAAQEMAAREGVKVIVVGEVAPFAGGFALTGKLIAPDGTQFRSARATANGPGDLLAALETISRKLREDLGESFRSIRASEPLDQVTTSSIEALRLYTQAERSKFAGADNDQIALLRQAIALDSSFAMAYRSLSAVLTNANDDPALIFDATQKAFRFRDHLPLHEALITEARYLQTTGQRERSLAIWERIIANWPDDRGARNNLGLNLRILGRYADAERVFAVVVDSGTASTSTYYNQVTSQVVQGKIDAARRTLAGLVEHYPNSPQRWQAAYFIAAAVDDDTVAYAVADSLAHAGALYRIWGHLYRAGYTRLHGRLREGAEASRLAVQAQLERGNRSGAMIQELEAGWAALQLQNDTAALLRHLEAAQAIAPLDSIPPAGRPYGDLIRANAGLGRIAEAKRLYAEFQRTVPADLQTDARVLRGLAWVALAEGRDQEAVTLGREAQEVGSCAICMDEIVGLAFERMGLPDSAIAAYDLTLAPPLYGSEYNEWRGPVIPRTLFRAAELYEAKGDRVRARERYATFIDLWKDADPEVQARVAEARRRVQELSRER